MLCYVILLSSTTRLPMYGAVLTYCRLSYTIEYQCYHIFVSRKYKTIMMVVGTYFYYYWNKLLKIDISIFCHIYASSTETVIPVRNVKLEFFWYSIIETKKNRFFSQLSNFKYNALKRASLPHFICTQVPVSDKNECVWLFMQSESIYVLKTKAPYKLANIPLYICF